MSSSEASSSLPADVISKRMFYGGCFALPWLWIVHTLHWYGKNRSNNNTEQSESLVNSNNNQQRRKLIYWLLEFSIFFVCNNRFH